LTTNAILLAVNRFIAVYSLCFLFRSLYCTIRKIPQAAPKYC